MDLVPQARFVATTSHSAEGVYNRLLGQVNLEQYQGMFDSSIGSQWRWTGEIAADRFDLRRVLGANRELRITGTIEPSIACTRVTATVKPGVLALAFLWILALAVLVIATVVGSMSLRDGQLPNAVYVTWVSLAVFLAVLWFAAREGCRDEAKFILSLLNAEPVSILPAAKRENQLHG